MYVYSSDWKSKSRPFPSDIKLEDINLTNFLIKFNTLGSISTMYSLAPVLSDHKDASAMLAAERELAIETVRDSVGMYMHIIYIYIWTS